MDKERFICCSCGKRKTHEAFMNNRIQFKGMGGHWEFIWTYCSIKKRLCTLCAGKIRDAIVLSLRIKSEAE